MRGNVVYFRARIGGKLRCKRAAYQGLAAFTNQGNPRPALLQELAEWIGLNADTGYKTLADMNMLEFAFEAVVCRHPEIFTAETLQRSRERMATWKDPVAQND